MTISAELITGIITFIGIAATFIVSIATHRQTTQNARMSKYIDVVTSERVKWIGSLRRDVSAIRAMALSWVHSMKLDSMGLTNDETQLIHKINNLRLKLNPKDDANLIKVLVQIEKTVVDKKSRDVPKLLDALVKEGQAILKQEWEKIKSEASGSRLLKHKTVF